MTNHDRRLGMDSEITRRDFLNGVARRSAVDGPAAAHAASVCVGRRGGHRLAARGLGLPVCDRADS